MSYSIFTKCRAYCLCTALLLSVLTGCGQEREWLQKEVLEEAPELYFYTCWPQSDARGAELVRLTENFNLQYNDEVTVHIQVIGDREQYNARIKALAAANELPDVFLLADTPDNSSIFTTAGRLLPLDFLQSERESYEVSEQARAYLYPAAITPVALFYHTGGADGNTPPVLSQFAALPERYAGFDSLFASGFSQQAGPALDLLFTLCQTMDGGISGEGREQAFTQALLLWRQYIAASHTADSLAYDAPAAAELWLGGSAALLVAEEPLFAQTGQGVARLATPKGAALCSETWGFAAKMTIEEERAALVQKFMQHISGQWAGDFLYPESREVLGSRLLATSDKENLCAALELFIAQETELDTVLALLLALPVWGKVA